MAAMEVAVLAVDLLLPVPSSMVATLGGAELGVVTGTACAWLGLTISAVAGWWLGRRAGGLALERLDPAERAALQRHEQRIGPLGIARSHWYGVLWVPLGSLLNGFPWPWQRRW